MLATHSSISRSTVGEPLLARSRKLSKSGTRALLLLYRIATAAEPSYGLSCLSRNSCSTCCRPRENENQSKTKRTVHVTTNPTNPALQERPLHQKRANTSQRTNEPNTNTMERTKNHGVVSVDQPIQNS